jgi:hypothetical protein
MTSTIQPPLLAWAWRIAVGDPRREPAILHHHRCVKRLRDLDGDGLIWILHPDEVRTRRLSEVRFSVGVEGGWAARVPLLVRHSRRLHFDIRRVQDTGGTVVCDTATNVLHNLSRLALGLPSMTPILIERLYDEPSGLFHQLVRPSGIHGPQRPHRVLTWAALAPLALPDLPESIGRRLVEEYLLNPRHFWLPVPPPSVAASEPTFR